MAPCSMPLWPPHLLPSPVPDPCEQYTNISDPWRNRGFSSVPSQSWPKMDSGLQEGWYRFTGVGGDTLDYVCFYPTQPKVSGAPVVDRVGLCNNSILNPYPSFFIKEKAMQLCAKTTSGCNPIGNMDVKFCSGGLFHVHKLKPSSNNTYATRESMLFILMIVHKNIDSFLNWYSLDTLCHKKQNLVTA